MILMLNVNNSTIELYTEEGVVRIPFTNAEKLYRYVDENSSMLYVTNATTTGPTDVVNMIKSMGVSVIAQVPVDSGVRYLHSPSKGTIYINEHLKFEGEFDIKPIDEKMTQTIQSNRLLQQLIKNKKIEVIGEIKRSKLMVNFKSNQDKLIEKQHKIDAGYDSIIVDGSAEAAAEAGGINTSGSNAEEINIMGAGGPTDSGGATSMSELMNSFDGE